MQSRKRARHRLSNPLRGHGVWHLRTPQTRTRRTRDRRLLVAVVLLLLVVAALTAVAVIARADTNSASVVTVVPADDLTWRCLRARGYSGTPADGYEALSVPLDQLRECARGDTLSV